MKKRTVAKLKVTRKLEDTLPAFLDRFSYPYWYLLKYISDFFIISTIRHGISTYRQFSATYVGSMPCHYNKKKLPSRQLLFYIPHPVLTGIYQRFFKYIDFSTYINDFFIISTFRHRLSTYRHPSTLKTHNIPYPPSNLLPNSTIKKITNRIASIFNATYATLKTA